MSSVYCHYHQCTRTCRGERDTQGRPLCDVHAAEDRLPPPPPNTPRTSREELWDALSASLEDPYPEIVSHQRADALAAIERCQREDGVLVYTPTERASR